VTRPVVAFGLDTSVVLRLVTGEPKAQAVRALELLRDMQDRGDRVLVSDLVIAEAYFALHWHYKVPKSEAVGTLLDFLQSGEVAPETGGRALETLKGMRGIGRKTGFVDRLIHSQYQRDGARLVSFETASSKLRA
jgi:predicted nucleic acid-binding protein